MTTEIAAPKPSLDATAKKNAFEAFCQEIIAALMHPLEYDSPLAAAKGSSITPNNRSSDELCCSHYSAICKD